MAAWACHWPKPPSFLKQERLSLVDALQVQGMVLSRQERWDEAERAFREGLELAHPMLYP